VVEETPTNTVTFSGDPADVLPERPATGNRADWWWRPDGSINDLDRDAAGS
jgi:6-pyruvoyltetrahydropterin/6-carboxytetrahydropterin synthase